MGQQQVVLEPLSFLLLRLQVEDGTAHLEKVLLHNGGGLFSSKKDISAGVLHGLKERALSADEVEVDECFQQREGPAAVLIIIHHARELVAEGNQHGLGLLGSASSSPW